MQRLIYDSWIGWFPKWSNCDHEKGCTPKVYMLRHDLLNFYIFRLGDRWFVGELRSGTSQFYSPHPKSLSQSGRGTLNPVPFLSFWEKGLGDEGKLIIGIPWGRSPFEHWIYLMQAIAGLWVRERFYGIFFLVLSSFPRLLPFRFSSSRLMYYSVVMRRSLLRSSIIA